MSAPQQAEKDQQFMIENVRLAIVGAGSRGTNYARLATASGTATVVAVVEPNRARREAFAAEYALPSSAVFTDWAELAALPPLADAAVIATPDRQHVEPAVALATAGYHLLLEKPMAPTREESVRIVDAVERAGVMLMVCHVMRYSNYSRTLKATLDAGRIGQIVSIEHLEPIGWWHFAHSYVRGNWSKEAESNSMLMAKSSHDLDWLSLIVGEPVSRVSSFGGLSYFTPENKPAGATDRCVTCPLVNSCAYSAPTIYKRFLGDPVGERWPLAVLADEVSPESIDEALQTGPYGRCVFNGDNDVADHQVVNIEYANGVTASFTVTAFTDLDFRKTRIFGTQGSIDGDGRRFTLHDFATNTVETIETEAAGGASAADGHGGADGALVDAFLAAVRSGDASLIESDALASLRTHEVVWAAEEARASGTVVSL